MPRNSWSYLTSWWFPSTHLKNISQIGSFPQIGMSIQESLKPPPSLPFILENPVLNRHSFLKVFVEKKRSAEKPFCQTFGIQQNWYPTRFQFLERSRYACIWCIFGFWEAANPNWVNATISRMLHCRIRVLPPTKNNPNVSAICIHITWTLAQNHESSVPTQKKHQNTQTCIYIL